MRVVVDTNVVVSAFLSPRGSPAQVLRRWRAQEFGMVASEPLLREYLQALQYERVALRHRMTPIEVAEVIDEMRQFVVLVVPQETILAVPDDPDDDRVVECAVAGAVDFIVSGDHHLLRLGEYHGIPVLSPATFLAVLDCGVG